MYKEYSYRRFIRDNCTWDGLIALDCDLMTRTYGSKFGSDTYGQFRLYEIKFGANNQYAFEQPRNYGQKMFYRVLDRVLSNSTESFRYEGFYVIWTDKEDWNNSTNFQINYNEVTKTELVRFFDKKFNDIERYDFSRNYL
jgi:hypothetical protein